MNKIVLAVAMVGATCLAWAEEVPSVTTNAQKVVLFHVPDGQTVIVR